MRKAFVTELWVEPQAGRALPLDSTPSYLHGSTATEFFHCVHERDVSVIKCICTFDYICDFINKSLYHLQKTADGPCPWMTFPTVKGTT